MVVTNVDHVWSVAPRFEMQASPPAPALIRFLVAHMRVLTHSVRRDDDKILRHAGVESERANRESL
eukprot:2308542-Prymnesium_polylepis.1